ncbi:MAG: hypothetical protein WBB28_07710 [Crinalium sp.]
MPYTQESGAIQVANKIREKVRSLNIIHTGSPIGQYVTLSLGVSSTFPHFQDLRRYTKYRGNHRGIAPNADTLNTGATTGGLPLQMVFIFIICVSPNFETLPETLIAAAEQALYQAKKAGGDRVVLEVCDD